MKRKKINPEEITKLLEKELEMLDQSATPENKGLVLQVNDGIAQIYGLKDAQIGELLAFDNGEKGLVLNLSERSIGAIILGDTTKIGQGDAVRRTKQVATLSVGKGMLGRVVDTLGQPIDGKGPIKGKVFSLPLERKAPGVIFRERVNQPMPTGIKIVDGLIPIGRGQRQLIIGDRQIGKTTLAIDAILNQRRAYEKGKPVFCIYVAIGQKASSIAQLVNVLEAQGAMDYTTIFSASASDSAALQYLIPFSATTLGELFRDMGEDALIIYDDLTKHANAYRELSLLLRRPPGREAYPGDVFYLHARLLERSGKINRNKSIAEKMNDLPAVLKPHVQGGGSLTALPIIETQAGDVSAYIPTNVISITDGQIFLEKDLFYADIRPAINVGISVSRVGGAAQTASMKKIAGSIKLSQAQARELEGFAKFGSNLDSYTQLLIKRGKINRLLFTQAPYAPVPLGLQISLLYVSNQGYLDNMPLDKIKLFEKAFSEELSKKYPEELLELEEGAGALSDDWISKVEQTAKLLVKKHQALS